METILSTHIRPGLHADRLSRVSATSRTMTASGSSPAVLAIQSDAPAVSFDNLVGAVQDRRRYGQAERLGSLEIDDQLELGRLLDR